MPVKYKYRQISLKDTFSDCQNIFVDDAPSFFQFLNEHFDIQEFIPLRFPSAPFPQTMQGTQGVMRLFQGARCPSSDMFQTELRSLY